MPIGSTISDLGPSHSFCLVNSNDIMLDISYGKYRQSVNLYENTGGKFLGHCALTKEEFFRLKAWFASIPDE